MKSTDHLWEVLRECWTKIEDELLHKLAESMPSRVKAAVKAKCRHKY